MPGFFGSKKPPLTEVSRIIVNLWLPLVNGVPTSAERFIKATMHDNKSAAGSSQASSKLEKDKNSRVGHVSILTPNHYVSWWPGESGVSLYNIVAAANSTYAQDCQSEDGKPDCSVAFYSLDVQALEAAFQEIERDDKFGYVLAGDKATTRLANWRSPQKGQSCCGLAYELLVRAGLSDLTAYFQDITARYLYLTPDNFCQLIQHAKESEVAVFEETRSFRILDQVSYPNEFVPGQKVAGCIIL